MGNLSDGIVQHKYEVSLAAMALTWGGFLFFLKQQNQQLRDLTHAIDPEIPRFPSSHSLPPVLSQKAICQELIDHKQYPIYRVALTGGPCAGKSTALVEIQKHFTESGFRVLVVPEVPTIVGMGGGLSDFGRYGSQERIRFQTDIIKFKIYFEDYIARLAEMSKQPCLILCDRGIVDCAAYMAAEEYQAVLDEEGWTWSNLRDRRYDSVIFMNTAADGAEEYYTLANNAARSESPAEARALDKKTLAAWIGHPYMSICPNIRGKNFDYKVGLAIKAVQKTVGLQTNEIIYHKLLVNLQALPADIVAVHSDIEVVYLRNDNPRYVQDKIKKRGQDNSFTYQRKFVGPYDPQQPFREVLRVSLNSLQFATLNQELAHPDFRPVHIKRLNFEWHGTYFSLDQYDFIPNRGEQKLLRFVSTRDREIESILPPWVEMIRDVREDKTYTISEVARRLY